MCRLAVKEGLAGARVDGDVSQAVTVHSVAVLKGGVAGGVAARVQGARSIRVAFGGVLARAKQHRELRVLEQCKLPDGVEHGFGASRLRPASPDTHRGHGQQSYPS